MCDKQNAVTHAIIELYVNLSALQVAQQSLSTSQVSSVIHFIVTKYENLDTSGYALGVQIFIFTSTLVYNLHKLYANIVLN